MYFAKVLSLPLSPSLSPPQRSEADHLTSHGGNKQARRLIQFSPHHRSPKVRAAFFAASSVFYSNLPPHTQQVTKRKVSWALPSIISRSAPGRRAYCKCATHSLRLNSFLPALPSVIPTLSNVRSLLTHDPHAQHKQHVPTKNMLAVGLLRGMDEGIPFADPLPSYTHSLT